MLRVLIPTDFSPRAALALRCACELARARRCELIVLHVRAELPLALAPAAGALAVTQHEAVDRALHAFAGPLRDAGLAHRCLQVVGSPHAALLRLAAEQGVDLIVMPEPIDEAILGALPLATRIARTSALPLVLTRDGSMPAGALSRLAPDEVADGAG